MTAAARPMEERYRNVPAAIELIRAGAKLVLITRCTGVPRPVLTQWYRDIHGRPATSGPPRVNSHWILRTRAGQILATHYAVCYAELAGTRHPRTVEAMHWLAAYRRWCASVPAAHRGALTISDAYHIADDLRRSQLQWHDCAACGRPWLGVGGWHYEAEAADACPSCQLLARGRRRKSAAGAVGHARACQR